MEREALDIIQFTPLDHYAYFTKKSCKLVREVCTTTTTTCAYIWYTFLVEGEERGLDT